MAVIRNPGANARNRAGRLAVAPDRPSSSKTVFHPAGFRAASCKAGFWSSVDTRVYLCFVPLF